MDSIVRAGRASPRGPPRIQNQVRSVRTPRTALMYMYSAQHMNKPYNKSQSLVRRKEARTGVVKATAGGRQLGLGRGHENCDDLCWYSGP